MGSLPSPPPTRHSTGRLSAPVNSALERMDEQRSKALQERTDAKLRYSSVHLDEIKALGPLGGNDFDRAHQESFLFHLFGARDALLAELNHYYGTNLVPESISPGRLRDALKQQGVQSPELGALYELENNDSSWFRQAKDMRDHSTHVQGVPRAYYLNLGGDNEGGKVKLKNPRTGQLTTQHLPEEFEDWLKQMTALIQRLRESALERLRSNLSSQGTPASGRP
jgi:hypothetical protein